MTLWLSVKKFEIYNRDLELLHKCDLLIAVLLFNNPGTLLELGMFVQANKPTIIYNPFEICKNIFVKHSPNYLCKDIGEVIDATYQCLKRR